MPRNPNKTDYSKGLPEGLHAFEVLQDPRTGGRTLHHFGEIIFMALASIVCGVKSYELMEEFCKLKRPWFEKWLELPHGIPCYNTFARVLEALDPVSFSQCIVNHLSGAGVLEGGGQIAIDGKALRGSRSGGSSHIHAVSAWACETGITLAQTFVSEKSNEITAIPELLKMLNIEDAVVTIDAMGTQREISEQIIDQDGDYVFCVKGNQGNLHNEIIDEFDFAARQLGLGKLSSENWSYAESLERGHGRIDKRQTVVCHSVDWMESSIRDAWKGLNCVVMVTRHSDLGEGKTRSETSYYMSSLEGVRAAQMQCYIRGHWGIENSCHWVLDTLFREDHNQTRAKNAAKNLSTLRRIALNALKQASDDSTRKRPKSLTKKQLQAAHDDAYLEEVLSLM